MSSIDKASAYPDTVQSGVPRLGATPVGWTRAPMSKHLYEERRSVDLKDDTTYDLVTVKRARGGVVKRETKLGRDISVKTQFRVTEGDFLISKRQIVHGACGLVPPELDGSTVSNEYAVLRSRGTIDLNFLKYLSHSVYFQQTCFHSSIGVHIEKMIFKLEKWLEWDFDLPPLSEQRRIAKVISTWDNAISTTEKLVAATQVQRREILQELMTRQRRLPGFSGEWAITSLKDVGETSSGGTPDSGNIQYWHGEIPWATPTDITALSDRFISETERHISPSGLSNSSAKLLPANSLLICTRATVGKSAICTRPMATNQGFKNIVPSSAYDVTFLYYLLNHSQRHLVRAACGSTFLELSKSDFEKLAFEIPPLEEQKAISAIMTTIDAESEALSKTLLQLRSERGALLQQLLSGKRRVNTLKDAA